jgi:FkbM family methyltransferase
VGAWYGPWTFALTEHFAQVVAIEPNPQVAARLAPSLPRIATLVRAAASDRRGEATLYAPAAVGAEGVGSLHSVGVGLRAHIVQMLPIDELGLDDVDFIKLDVEGHELPALRGASATIERCRPTIIAELEERLAPTAPVFRYLADLGYRPHLLNGTKLEGVDPGNFATHTCLPTSYLSAVLRPGAHHRQNNVIFLPR